MNRRKILRLVTIVTLIAMLLTACSGTDTDNKPIDTENPEVESPDVDPVTPSPDDTDSDEDPVTPSPDDTDSDEDPVTPSPDDTDSDEDPVTPSPDDTDSDEDPVVEQFSIEMHDLSTFGRASWKHIDGAFYYLCKIYTVENNERVDVIEYTLTSDYYGSIITSTYIPRGYGVEVIPLDADRQAIPTDQRLISDVYSNIAYREPYRYPSTTPEVHPVCDVLWKDLISFDILDSINPESIVKNDDGTITFDVTTPEGKTVRFLGKDVELKDGKLVIRPLGQIWSLDSLGQIFACDLHTVGNFQMADSLIYRPMYTFRSDKTSVSSVDELYEGRPDGNNGILAAQDYIRITGYISQGNFFSIGTHAAYGLDPIEVTLDQLIVYYNTDTYTTPLKSLDFDRNFTGSYLVGDLYDASRERFDPEAGILDFYLQFEVDATGLHIDYTDYVPFQSDKQFTIGELRDTNGNVLNKQTDGLTPGATIDVTIGDYTIPAPLWVLPRVDYARTHHELVPSAYPEAKGDLNVLVVPLVWQDTPDIESAETLTAIYNSIGRVIDESGNVKDYSDGIAGNGFALSEYYDIASYGQLNITSFVTNWCHLPHDASQNAFALSYERAVEIIDNVYAMYPDMDFSSFDKDGNGYFDAVIFINVDTIGVMTRNFYTTAGAGTADKLGINCYSNISAQSLTDFTIIHEFGHVLGLIDYYDVQYSGIDAVGSFDMQSQSAGDWNPYSKYSVGWITPEVVTGLESGESVEIEIGAFADTGDAIVIPGAESYYNGTPFGEYIMIDLFTDRGLNEADAESFGLKDALGVRIYHVNSVMEGRVLSRDGSELSDAEIAEAEEVYPIGTVNKTNTYSEIGSYHIELIQAGGDNTFTDLANLRTSLQKNDLFAEGDSFDAAEYTEFFHNGLLDDRKDFGYIIEIVSITEGDAPTATIRITRK